MGDPVLRKALLAPPGSKVLVGDLAQIEARLVAWFCKAETLLSEFKEKRDPYSRLAEVIFSQDVNKDTMGGVARHIGKAGILGCGYGMGHEMFYDSVLKQSRSQLDANQMEVLRNVWTLELAAKSVKAYRSKHYQVRDMWGILKHALESAWLGKLNQAGFPIGPVRITNRNGCGLVVGPGGREIRYPRAVAQDGELIWFSSELPRRIYGANLLENIIQFLARVIMFDIAMRLWDRDLKFVHQVHDELVFIVPDNGVEDAAALLRTEMRTPPHWCRTLPLDCDVAFAQRYGDCK